MKTAYVLNANPSSALKSCKFPIMCTIKNEHKNNPVNAMINFWPREDENILITQFILLYLF
jgi:hypothetical protein